MTARYGAACLGLILGALAAFPAQSAETPDAQVNAPPTPKDWAALATLPDWSGVWTPYISDQNARIKKDPTPWLPAVAQQIDAMNAADHHGKQKIKFIDLKKKKDARGFSGANDQPQLKIICQRPHQ